MNNEDLLEKIEVLFKAEREQTKKIVRTEIEAETKHMRSDVSGQLLRLRMEASNRISGIANRLKDVEISNTALDTSLGTLEKNLINKIETVDLKIEVVNKRAETIEKNVNQSIQDNAGFFQETGVTLDQIRNGLLQKIKAIEKFVGFPTASKN